MSKSHKRIQTCKVCARATNDAYICRRCAAECHDLLVGSSVADGQPGIVWYIVRLRESAYGQTRLSRSLSARSSNSGYALLGNKHAAELLARIGAALARWEAVTVALRSTHASELGWLHAGYPTRNPERLDVWRARFIAANVVLLRHHCADVNRLYAEMLSMAREAWRIINRPNDICCGPCPTMVKTNNLNKEEFPCGTLLYAEEDARSVICPLCHTQHNVESLRDRLKAAVQDMLFTRAELVNLMETRLNDRIPQPTFTKLLRDGRLQPRAQDKDGNDVFTYNDVCEARSKEPPHKRIQDGQARTTCDR